MVQKEESGGFKKSGAAGQRKSVGVIDCDIHHNIPNIQAIFPYLPRKYKEQIEISRAYERMPNPALLATQEFMEDKVYFRKGDDQLFD